MYQQRFYGRPPLPRQPVFPFQQTGYQTAGTGVLSGLTKNLSLDSIQSFAGNAQKMINSANQFMPLIHQYGPLIKNFPAMWKLYRSLNDEPDGGSEAVKEIDEGQYDQNLSGLDEKKPRRSPAQIKSSVPKLYI
ncbi:YqfQ family protein [Jeotgalibacillus aurantiacus]|uniref:YqfQ family protein n=1 Tax=Jeotgalibacillus aurantiacus TaxID=2763266 RepID=UPI001D0A8F3D|nr:YqfQ family protein [Jeotgalibacillus aurantiacus]